MKLQRFISQEQLPSRASAGTMDWTDFTQVGRAGQALGTVIRKIGDDMAETEKTQQLRRQKAEEDLAVNEGFTRYKTRAYEIQENKRQQYAAMDSLDSEAQLSKFMPETVDELKELANDKAFDGMTPMVKARFRTEVNQYIQSQVPELSKKSSELIVQRSEARLGESEEANYRASIDATDADQLMRTVGNYNLELQKAVASGSLGKDKAEERFHKFHERAAKGWFERMTTKNPEGLFRAINTDDPAMKNMLAPVGGKEIAAFVRDRREQAGKDVKSSSAALAKELFPMAVSGRLTRDGLKEAAPHLEIEDFNKLEAQLDQNDQRVQNAITEKRHTDERNLKQEQDTIEREFWDSFYTSPSLQSGHVSLLQNAQLKKLQPERYEKIMKTLSETRDDGGPGDQNRTEYWKMQLMHNSKALSGDQILDMTSLNYAQRQELYQAKKNQEEFEKSSHNQKHFSNDPNYKFYSGQIQEQLGIIKLSPFTNASAIQIVSQAEVAFRDSFSRLIEKQGSVSQEEAKQMMKSIVKNARENLSMKSIAIGEVPRYSDGKDLLDAFQRGDINHKQFTEEYEKLKAWRALQGKDANGKDLEQGDEAPSSSGSSGKMKPERQFKKRGKE